MLSEPDGRPDEDDCPMKHDAFFETHWDYRGSS